MISANVDIYSVAHSMQQVPCALSNVSSSNDSLTRKKPGRDIIGLEALRLISIVVVLAWESIGGPFTSLIYL